MFLLVGVCAAVLLIGALKRHSLMLINLVLRCVTCTLAIFFINLLLEKIGITGSVGINPVSVLTCTILGFPGLAALYGIYFYKVL